MKLIRLRRGEIAPADAAAITINELPNGKFGFMGVGSRTAEYLARAAPTYTVITPNEFESYDEAEAAAMSWAKSSGVVELYVEGVDA